MDVDTIMGLSTSGEVQRQDPQTRKGSKRDFQAYPRSLVKQHHIHGQQSKCIRESQLTGIHSCEETVNSDFFFGALDFAFSVQARDHDSLGPAACELADTQPGPTFSAVPCEGH